MASYLVSLHLIFPFYHRHGTNVVLSSSAQNSCMFNFYTWHQGPPQHGTCLLNLTSTAALTTYPAATLGHSLSLFNVPVTFLPLTLLVQCCLLSTGSHVWVSMTLLPLLGFTGETANQSDHHLSAGLDSDSESSTRGSCGLSQQTEMDIKTNTVFHVALVQLWPLYQVIGQDPGPMASLLWHFLHLPASVDHFALATAHRPSPWGFCLLVFGFAW